MVLSSGQKDGYIYFFFATKAADGTPHLTIEGEPLWPGITGGTTLSLDPAADTDVVEVVTPGSAVARAKMLSSIRAKGPGTIADYIGLNPPPITGDSRNPGTHYHNPAPTTREET